jgi:protein-S-isoprenylcysteine O-methyltransferase Ste14
MTTDSGGDLVRRAAREWWPNLPMLLVGSIAVAAGWAMLRSVAAGSGWVALLGIGVLVVPVLAGLLDGCLRLLDDQHVGALQLLRGLPAVVVRSWRVTGPVTLVALLTDAAAVAWQRGGQPWMLVSLGICTAVLLGLVLVGVIALPYALSSRAGGRETWLVGAYLATRHPVLAVGVLSACGVAVWAAAHLSFALLILLPAPLALIWAAAASEASLRGRVRLAGRGRQLA